MFAKLYRYLGAKWFNVQEQTSQSVQSVRDAIIQGGLIIVSAIVVVWLSIFLYTAFYYAYMPSMSYIRPVHLQFSSCKEKSGICSHPEAEVQLTKKQQILMIGQPYKVNLHLEMPESPANKELGMFMVCAQFIGRNGFAVERSCRSAMLHYRSTLLHLLKTFVFSPMLIFGFGEEKQHITVELFGNFEDDQSNPVTTVKVQILSRYVEFYSVTIGIHAHLSGLRYLMFHWPILSAIVGIGTNLFFIAFVCVLSYFHFSNEESSLSDNGFGYKKGDAEEKSIMDRSDSNVSIESLLVEFEGMKTLKPVSPSNESEYVEEFYESSDRPKEPKLESSLRRVRSEKTTQT